MENSLYSNSGLDGDTDSDKTQELKKNMFLDFASGNTKQQKFASLLASPDFNMLKVASPELEKMLFASNGLLQTPTPTQFIYPKYVTDEQEAYARGFVEALAQLHGGIPGQPGSVVPGAQGSQSSSSSNPSSESSVYSQFLPTSASGSVVHSSASNLPTMPKKVATSSLATTSKPPTSTVPSVSLGFVPSATSLDLNVKSEPFSQDRNLDHTVPTASTSLQVSPTPSSSRLSDSPSPAPISPGSTVNMDNDHTNLPIDLDDQESIKVERKRARNRIAARKCRTRKLERISRLEEKVNDLKNKNNELLQHATSLNEQVVQLKQQIVDHMKTGCQIMMPNIQSLTQT